MKLNCLLLLAVLSIYIYCLWFLIQLQGSLHSRKTWKTGKFWKLWKTRENWKAQGNLLENHSTLENLRENYKLLFNLLILWKCFLFHLKSSFLYGNIYVFIIVFLLFHTYPIQRDIKNLINLWCHEWVCECSFNLKTHFIQYQINKFNTLLIDQVSISYLFSFSRCIIKFLFRPSQDVLLSSYLDKPSKQQRTGKKEGKTDIQKFEYLENKSILNEIKSIFPNLLTAIIWSKNWN